MTTINATTLRNNLSDAVKKISGSNDFMLITNKGKITSALIDVDLLEDLLELSDPEYLESIKKARAEIASGEFFTHEEVFGDI